MRTREETIKLAKGHFDDGDLIEAGFVLKMLLNAPENLSPVAIEIVRMAFFLGAEYMLHTMAMPDHFGNLGDEVAKQTVANLRKELNKFHQSIPLETAH